MCCRKVRIKRTGADLSFVYEFGGKGGKGLEEKKRKE